MLRQSRGFLEGPTTTLAAATANNNSSNSSENSSSPFVFLLQPTLHHRDYGANRWLEHAVPTATWSDVLQFLEFRLIHNKTSGELAAAAGESLEDSDSIHSNDGDDDDYNDYDRKDSSSTSSFEDCWRCYLTPDCHLSVANATNMEARTSLWCTVTTLREALRTTFRQAHVTTTTTTNAAAADPVNARVSLRDGHRRAVQVYPLLPAQVRMWKQRSVHTERNIRVTAVAQCVAVSEIQMPLLVWPWPSSSSSAVGNAQTTSAATTITTKDNKDEDPIRIHAPTGGVVGEQPVLRPGTAFEYYSAAMVTASGRMQGCLDFGTVSLTTVTTTTATTNNHTVETTTGAGQQCPLEEDQTKIASVTEFFQVPIAPFPLSTDY